MTGGIAVSIESETLRARRQIRSIKIVDYWLPFRCTSTNPSRERAPATCLPESSGSFIRSIRLLHDPVSRRAQAPDIDQSPRECSARLLRESYLVTRTLERGHMGHNVTVFARLDYNVYFHSVPNT